MHIRQKKRQVRNVILYLHADNCTGQNKNWYDIVCRTTIPCMYVHKKWTKTRESLAKPMKKLLKRWGSQHPRYRRPTPSSTSTTWVFYLHADNCSGQNKNRYIMHVEEIKSGFNRLILVKFLLFHLHADNCTGQNKNRYKMYIDEWSFRHDQIEKKKNWGGSQHRQRE